MHAGALTRAPLRMDAAWNLCVGGCDRPLGLACVFPWGDEAMYLFSARDREEVVEALPKPVEELLLFAPLVPLRRRGANFQGLTDQEWEALVVTEMADRPTCASLAPAAAPRDDEDWEEEAGSVSSSDGLSASEVPVPSEEELEEDDALSCSADDAASEASL